MKIWLIQIFLKTFFRFKQFFKMPKSIRMFTPVELLVLEIIYNNGKLFINHDPDMVSEFLKKRSNIDPTPTGDDLAEAIKNLKKYDCIHDCLVNYGNNSTTIQRGIVNEFHLSLEGYWLWFLHKKSETYSLEDTGKENELYCIEIVYV